MHYYIVDEHLTTTEELLLQFIDNQKVYKTNILETDDADILSLEMKKSVLCQTSKSLTASTPRKNKLRKFLRAKSNRLNYIKSRYSSPNGSKNIQMTLNDYMLSVGVKFPPLLYELVKTQFELHKPKKKAPRYSDMFKQFALTIYFLGPKVYRMLSKTIKLTSKRLLSKTIENWPNEPGLTFCLKHYNSKCRVSLK